jgi:hypothetical protein
MLAGPPSKKRKLNEIANDENMEEEKENPENLKRKIKELEDNYGKALTWIHAAEEHIGQQQPKFQFEI